MINRVVVEPAELLALFAEGCNWADEISTCIARADSIDESFQAWMLLSRNLRKIRKAIVNLERHAVDPALVHALNSCGSLRVAAGTGTAMNANLWYFRHGQEVRALLGSADFSPRCFERAINATMYATGTSDEEFFLGVERLMERATQVARVPTLRDLSSYETDRSYPPDLSGLPVARIVVREGLTVLSAEEMVQTQMVRLATAFGTTLRGSPDGRSVDLGQITIRETASHWSLCLFEPQRSGTIEVVVAKGRPDGRSNGMFVVGDAANNTYFAYRGVFQRRSRVAEELFWATTRYNAVEVALGAQDDRARVALVCELESIDAPSQLAGFAAELWRLRELVPAERLEDDEEESANFLDEDEEAQVEIVWNLLLGAGPLERDMAIRSCAETMRDAGVVSYKRLDSGGKIYTAIESSIALGLKAGVFDRPSRGFVRAIARDLDDEGWRHCLLQVLSQEPMERLDAIRETAEYAKEYFGIQFERLRTGGRIERAIKSAINNCIRRDLIIDHGRDLIARATGSDATE